MTVLDSIRRWWWLLLMTPIVASAWARELWAPDEPRYAQVAREIWEGGSFLVMHLCGDLYPDKPPLLYWLAGVCGRLADWSELAVRIPSLVATAGTALLVAWVARRWWGGMEAVLAPALLLTTAMVTEIGGRLQIDPLLTALCTAALALVATPVTTDRQARLAILGAGLCVGLAALAKGPPAWINVGLPVVAWVWLAPTPAMGRVRIWTWFGAAALAVLPVFSWAVAASMVEPKLVNELFFGQHIGRVTHADRHPGPVWKHMIRMPGLLLPWTVVVGGGLWRAIAGWRQRSLQPLDRGLVRAAGWLLVLFLFYSVIPPKRDLYLLPAYPAAALLAARELALRMRWRQLPAWMVWPGPAVLVVIGAALPVVGMLDTELPGLTWQPTAIGLPLVVAGVFAVIAAHRGRLRSWIGWQLGGWAVFATVFALSVVPLINPVKSARILAEQLAQRADLPTEIPCVGVQPEGYRYYGGIPTVRRDGMADLWADLARHEEFLALVEENELAAASEELRQQVVVEYSRDVGSKDVLILTRR